MKKIEGGITAAKGFEAASAAARIKYEGRTDMALVFSEAPCVSAGTFTTNVVKAAPVIWDRDLVQSGAAAHAVIVNSGIANACTGDEGLKICKKTCEVAGKTLGISPESVLVGSTGVIGPQIPFNKLEYGINLLSGMLSSNKESASGTAETVEQVEKEVTTEAEEEPENISEAEDEAEAEGDIDEEAEDAVQQEAVEAETEKDGAEDKAEQEEETVPAEYKAALNKAMQYSDIMHMSKAGIYDQLTSEYGEKFPAEAAQYAVDHMEADWNANALAKAENYSQTMYMSKQGIYDQLISEYGEKFTADEAQYAIDHIQADWNENALKKAKNYRETMDMSDDGIYDQLTSEYGEQFTSEEADYAMQHIND